MEEESSGSEYRLVDWSERVSRDDLGESNGGLPSPLVDKLHRLMALFQRTRRRTCNGFTTSGDWRANGRSRRCCKRS